MFWRVEGSLLNLTAVRPVGFFTWNAQSFLGRWARRGAMGVLAVARPFLYASDRVFATRVLHAVLRHTSRDRLDLLGEEYFEYVLKPRLKPSGVEALKRLIDARQAAGERPLTFAVVFPYSLHNYMLRYWLAEAGWPGRELASSRRKTISHCS